MSRPLSKPTNPSVAALPGLAAATAWGRVATGMARMNLAAAEVVLRRTTMIATGSLSAPEAAKMVLEKHTAFAAAAEKAAMAALRGGDAAAVASAALRPLQRRASANARRLRG